MTLTFTYDGAAVTHNIAPSTVSITSAAEQGEVAMSGLMIEDPDSDLSTLGHRPFIIEDDACSQPRLFTGWTTERDIGRSYEDGMHGDATARAHDLTVVDLNALFNFRIISGTDGNRPREKYEDRMAWIIGSDYLDGLIEDTGYMFPTHDFDFYIDAADYRNQYPSAVLEDLINRHAVREMNYFAFWDPVAAAVSLYYDEIDSATNDSTLRISNVLADIDSTTTFAPDPGARLGVTPTETYSEVVINYARGTKRLFRSRESTATKYIRRGTTIDRPYTTDPAKASEFAEAFLDHHANERDRITVTIQVPAAKVGLVYAGQRMDVKFSHLDGYTSFTSMRVVRMTTTPVDDLARYYLLALELLAPRTATSSGGCVPTLVQSAFEGNSGNGILTGGIDLPDAPATAGNLLVALVGLRATDLWTDQTPVGWTNYGYTRVGNGELWDKDLSLQVCIKIAEGGETQCPIGGASGIIAEFEDFCGGVVSVQLEGVDVEGTIATYPAITPTTPGATAVIIRADWKYPPDPGGSMTLTGWDLLEDTGFAASGNRDRLTSFYLAETAAASYPALARSSSGT
ncbi:MAG TPA: hypothetical protein VM285_03715, partial [Polyangia bacterium]|nr:hypothetical protein [Polyangia bacterium]